MQEQKFPENLAGPDQLTKTSQALDIWNELKPLLDEWLKKLSHWRQTYLQARELASNLRGRIKYSQEEMDRSAPLVLSGVSFRQRLQEIETVLAALQNRLAAASIEELDGLYKEILDQETSLKTCMSTFDSASQQAAELEEGLKELNRKYKALPPTWTHPEYPDYSIELDETGDWLNALRSRLDPFLGEGTKFPAEELDDHMEKLRALQGDLDHLVEKKEQSLKDFRTLVGLLESEQLREGEKWCLEARATLQAAQKYSDKNWNNQIKISEVARDLNMLELLQRSYVDAVERPVSCESELKEDLARTQKLADLHKQVREQVARIGEQVGQVSAHEEEAKAEIGRAIATLQELLALQARTALLPPAAESELKRLSSQAESLKEDINQPAVNSLKSKTDRLKALTDLLLRHYNRWLEQVAERTREETRKVSSQLKDLEQVAQFNDPEVKDGEKLLRELGPIPASQRSTSYFDAATSLVRCAETCARVNASREALLKGATLETLAARQEAENARAAASSAFEKGDKSLREGGWGWIPPDWQKAQKEQEKLSKRLGSTRGQLWDARELTKKYRELAGDFNAQKAENDKWLRVAEEERSQLTTQEGALNNLLSQLKTRPELRARAQEASREIGELKRVYSSGARTCEQVLADMKTLEEELGALYFAK